jgi:ribosomal protein S18 acetylase RimI-like enzyme
MRGNAITGVQNPAPMTIDPSQKEVRVRNTQSRDISSIVELSRRVYRTDPWHEEQLVSHLNVFPEGQLVAVQGPEEKVVGMAASLIVHWDDYDLDDNWRDFTDAGMFTNHDPEGRTLYGAEVMVDPEIRRCGIGGKLYRARRSLARRLQLRRIRAASRLRGYHRHAASMSAREYVQKLIRAELRDPTLSFQLNHGFRVIAVISGYLRNDPESLGYAAVIEWSNTAAPPPTRPEIEEGDTLPVSGADTRVA